MVFRDVFNIREWPILLAERHERAGRAPAAETIYRKILARQPQRPSALIGLGRLLMRGSRFEEAVDVWQRMVTIAPHRNGPAFQLARALHRSGRLEAAVAQYLRVLAITPRFEKAFTALEQLRDVVDRDPSHAAAFAEHLNSFGPARLEIRFEHLEQDVGAHLSLARQYEKSNEWDQAETVYRRILERSPDDPNALQRLAQLLSRDSGRLEQALDLWRLVAQRAPTAPFPLVQRAQLLERARRTADAEADYREALKRAPMDAAALFGLARLTFGQARWGVAAVMFDAFYKVNPNRGDALVGLGRSLEKLDRTDEALTAYRKVLAIEPTNANALLYSGRLLRQLGRTEEAIETWQKAVRQLRQNADAWYELVLALARAERDAEALAALAAADAALPASVATWVRLGQAAQAAQFHDRAAGYFEAAIAAEPLHAAHHARLGQHYFRQGVIDGAFHHLLASREREPADVAVAKQLVDTVHALNLVGIDHLQLATEPRHSGEVLIPERLFPIVRRIADTQIVPYKAVPRRIIVVTSSLAAGGAERQVVNLLRGLADPDLGIDPALFCISLAPQTQRDFFLPLLAEASVAVITPVENAIETCLDLPESAPFAQLIRSFPADMSGLIAFWLREFRRRRPQVVHAWQDGTNLTAVVAALLAGVPRVVLSTRSVRPDNPRRRLKRFMQEGYQSVIGHPTVTLCNNSRAGAEDYADWLGIDPATIEVVHNGIDFEQLAQCVDPTRAPALRQSLGVPPDAPLIGSAFRMSEEKRPLLWVEVAAEIARRQPRAHFLVFGDGPMRADMLTHAARLGIADRLHLPGREDDIGSCYKAMDVVLLTSRHEGLPNVLLEAQSLGVPVVAPDVGGVAETIWPGVTGWAVRDAAPHLLAPALAEHVVRCLTEPGWMTKAQAEAPSFVRERFSMTAMMRRTLDVYGLADINATDRPSDDD
ncbi:tetratricopeptide repeat protein [Reyranella sp.]|uniref:tetratricopeptide repeat protein n=1 Tax=Reyranella sp. TaxID=1929291 RepID=UPI002731E640|nr:tetratricopeptide repeat protein [Reyranella sp.]